MIVTLISAVLSQAAFDPPAQCREQCQNFNLSPCRQEKPTTEQEWQKAVQRLSDCICPIVLRNQNTCGACLNSNAPDSSIYYSQLASKCVQKTVGEELKQLWDISKAVSSTGPPSAVAPQKGTKPPAGAGIATSLSVLSFIPLLFL